MLKHIEAARLRRRALRPAATTDSFAQSPVHDTPVAEFHEPWAMAFLPDGRLLVTEKRGALKLHYLDDEQDGGRRQRARPSSTRGRAVSATSCCIPNFAANGLVYLSYAEPGERGTAGAAVARARLALEPASAPALEGLTVIWRQTRRSTAAATTVIASRSGPTASSTSAPASGRSSRRRRTCNKISARSCGSTTTAACRATIRSRSAAASPAQIWSLGHRNPLGLAFDAKAGSGTWRWARAAATS